MIHLGSVRSTGLTGADPVHRVIRSADVIGARTFAQAAADAAEIAFNRYMRDRTSDELRFEYWRKFHASERAFERVAEEFA